VPTKLIAIHLTFELICLFAVNQLQSGHPTSYFLGKAELTNVLPETVGTGRCPLFLIRSIGLSQYRKISHVGTKTNVKKQRCLC
jgi:hypothetical protein